MTLASGNIVQKLSDLTPYWLKTTFLAGLSITDANNKEFTDPFYEEHLMNAAAKIEKLCDICIVERTIKREEHDYRITDYANWGYLQLYKVPVRSVSEVRAVYPLGTSIAVFPAEWTNINGETGQLFLIPARGNLGQIIVGQGGDFIPLFMAGLSYLPSLWQVDYVAGFDPDDFPRMIAEAIGKMAAIDVLTIVSNIVHEIGVTSQSVSIDGMSESQSYTNPAFAAQIDRYTQDLYGPNGKRQELAMTSGLLKQIFDAYRPLNMASL